jgi:MFS family permease
MALAQFLPFTLFGLFAGVITDRLDARRLVIGTQAAQLVTAVALAALALGGVARPWMLYAIAFLNGIVLVLDVPSRQQLTYRMVGREALPNAIALNSTLFNASRIFGPAAAGMAYGFIGAGPCFLINAVSYLAVLLSLFWMRPRDFFTLETFERPTILRGTREGLAYVVRQPRMVVVVALTLVISTFSFNFNVTLPVLAYTTLHTQAVVYGLLSALFGAGALVGALAAAALGRASARVMIAGGILFTGSELLLAPVHTPFLAGALLFVTGAGFTAWSANSNTSMQLAAPDRLRGRIIGIYFYAFNGTGPFAGLLAGWLCARGGTQLAFLVAGGAGLAGTLAAAGGLRRRRSEEARDRLVAARTEARRAA